VITVTFNRDITRLGTIEEFSAALDRFDAHSEFELWLNAESGAAMSMMRNSTNAFLVYLKCSGDSAFVSNGWHGHRIEAADNEQTSQYD
jgi:hypothetical protein